MDSEYTKPGILDNIWKILPDWKLFKGSSSYEHFSDEEDNDDNEENIIKTKTRARRAGFSAVHFQKEKIQKQIIAAMKRRDSTQLENTINGIDLCEIEERGEDWLFLKKACDMDATDLTAVLLRHNADINFFGCGSCVPLHIASKKGNLPMCALLLSKGAKINLLTKYEFKSALHLATLEGHDAVAKLLLENEADVNIRDIYGETPLQIASRLGRKNIVELFLTYHASINEYNLDGWTGLHLASESGNVAIVSVLLDHKANIDCQTKYGRTSLSWACASNQLNVVDELLKRGADANILDLHNKKAYQHARNTAIKSLVLKHTEKEDPLGEKFVSTIGLFIEIDPRRDSLYPKKQKQIAQVLNLWKPISHENNTSHESKNCNPSHRMSLQTTEDGSPNPSSSALMVKDQVQASFSNLNANTTIQLNSLETNLERLVRDISISQHQTGSNGNDLLIVVDELVENVNHLRGSFTREMKALLQAYAETKDDAAHRRTGSLSYIALLQMFRQTVIDYISSKPSGWEEFLKNLSIPSELRDILTVKLKVGSLNERAKIEYLLSYWAKHNDEFAKEPGQHQFYMKIICEDIKKCEFEDEKGQTSEVITDLLKLSLDLKGGYSYDSSAKINVLLSNLSAKEINTLLNEMTSQALDTNMFPELGDILEDITGVVKTNEPPEQNNIPDSSSEKLKELLCQAIETEDIEKLAVIVRDLILSEHEDLLIFIL